eukprot:6175351-Pleurochrysis_carterae.AAC.2
MLTSGTVKIFRKGLRGTKFWESSSGWTGLTLLTSRLPISTQGKKNIRPDLSRLYPLSVTQNGLRSHLNSSRSGNTHSDCRCGDRSERRGARRGSNQLISSRGGGSQGDNPTTRRPGRGSPLAQASCECAPRAGVRGGGQGGRQSHCQLSHERSKAVDSRRVRQFDV